MGIKDVVKKPALSIINNALVSYFKMRKRTPRKGPVTVVGMFRAPTGLGNSVRLILQTLQNMRFKITVFDVSKLFVKQFNDIALPENMKQGEGGILLIKNNPIHLPIILFLIGFSKIKYKSIILCAVYELDYIPKTWVKPCELVDEIWVPSDFSADVYKKFVPGKTVRTVPDFVRVSCSKEKYSEQSNKIKIISAFDINSGFFRKNPIGVLNVFSQINRSDVEFIIKISGRHNNEDYYNMIIESAAKIKNLTIIEEKLSDQEKNELIQSADILVSLHRSEGFGLILAEAMLLGTSILCTGWSAPPTFLPEDCASYVKYKLIDVEDPQGKYENKGKWADPDLKDALQKLNDLIDDRELREDIANRAHIHAKKYFSDDNFEKWIRSSEIIEKYAEAVKESPEQV